MQRRARSRTYWLGRCVIREAYSPCAHEHEGACVCPNPSLPTVLMNKRVAKSVTVAGIQERVLADGRLEVTANLLSKDRRRIQVQISCVFKDQNGFSTGDETSWNTLILTENAQEALRFMSMNEKARKYPIRVREAR